MSTIVGIVLRDNKQINEVSVPSSVCTGHLDVSLINDLKNKGSNNIERECDFEWQGDTVSMYAWDDGNESHINKHDLPPPIDNVLYYGDILVLRHNNGNLINFSKDNYNTFYEDAFGGFDDIVSEECSSEDDPTQSDLDFIASEGDVSDGEDEATSESEALSDSDDSEYEEDSAELDLHDDTSESPNNSREQSVNDSSINEAQSSEEVTHVQEVKPTEEVKPVQEVKPNEEVKPVQEVNLIEEASASQENITILVNEK